MEVNKKELKEQEIRTLFITPALQQKGWAVSVNMREEYYFTDGRVLVVGNWKIQCKLPPKTKRF
ncbi:hypothetical protein, partial [Bacteroides uniformis]|uniref:hypothetical protein n=1 Tax=Bacteroides uniformis TaxID=820 RepID=UPI0022E04185